MPKMKNFDEVGAFVHAVVNEDWGVHELPHLRMASNRATDKGKALE